MEKQLLLDAVTIKNVFGKRLSIDVIDLKENAKRITPEKHPWRSSTGAQRHLAVTTFPNLRGGKNRKQHPATAQKNHSSKLKRKLR